ncbi:MAG TPA: outer membrane beta-barrel protein, partial [Bacteroidia bacterium]|nr:outer membrane beta-barrel protein [Bacteroidia bacterium]
NTIKVDNNSKVIILVDGLEKDQEYIKNLSPDRLKKIEVIRSPGGRYGLEGYSAVINIILKKDYRGTEVFLSDRTMVKPDAAKPEYIPVQNNVNATLNYVYNNLNVYATGYCNYNNFNLQSSSVKSYTNGLTINNALPTPSDMNTNVKQVTYSGTLGADYALNPKHTISFESNLESQPGANNNAQISNQLSLLNNGVVSNIQNTNMQNTTDVLNTRNSLFYVGKLNENNELTSNFTYYTHQNTYSNLLTNNSFLASQEQGTDRKNSTKFYLEYLHTFKGNSSLQLGYGNSWESQNNTFRTDSSSSRFLYSEFRHKLYAYYSWQLSKKIGLKLGGAAESSSRDANGQYNTYLIGEPFANIQYKPSGLVDFNLKYRSESNYPGIDQTNPFTVVIDPYSERTGNPYLSPDVMHRISLLANLLGGLVQLEPYFHFSPNYITESGALLTNGIFEYSYSNVGFYQSYGTQIRLNTPVGKGTNLYLESDADLFNCSISDNGKVNNLRNWTMSSQLVYVAPKTNTVIGLKYQKNLLHIITAQGYQTSDNDYWITFIQTPLLKNKLNIMLLYFIPLDAGVNYNQGSYIKTDLYTESKVSD